MNVVNYLKQPFPKAEKKWKVIILISFFVALFLIIFQPFGISLFKGGNKVLILSGYGLITFFTLIVNLIIIENIFTKFFDERNWAIWKEFIWLLWIIFSIGLGNAIYTSILFDFYFKATVLFFIQFQLFTLVIGIIPITILIVSKQKYLSNKYSISAQDVNRTLEKEKPKSLANQQIRIFGDNQKDFIEIEIRNFLFIESSGNYIEVHYIENDKDIRKTLRNTIKNSLNFFKDIPEVLQCHRAFIVNIEKIMNVKGNSQGLRLDLENCDMEVPVSRGFVNSVREKINYS